ncbi:MAG: zinc ribbon domain-containing protein [Candidatus Heimdallarchaeota archaeon]|nr:zinc ribbon domain-containing protein [Candidatus Heimdallarchaeota archaeon]
MARNRFLFDILGIILGFGATGLLIFLTNSQTGTAAITLSAVGVLGGALILGFFCYKNDGVKIAAILWGIIIIGCIALGVILITSGASGFLEAFVQDVLTAIIGPIFAIILIVMAIILMVGSVLIGGLFIAFTAIGSAIGEAVWKDKKDKKFAAAPGQTYVPSQDAYQPVIAAKPQSSTGIVCKNCSVSSPAGEKFCTNCGTKL